MRATYSYRKDCEKNFIAGSLCDSRDMCYVVVNEFKSGTGKSADESGRQDGMGVEEARRAASVGIRPSARLGGRERSTS